MDAEVVEYSDRLEKAEKKIYTLETKLEEQTDSIHTLNREITRLANLLDQAGEEKEALKDYIISLERQSADLSNDYAELYQKHERTKATIVRLIKTAVPLIVVSFLGIGYLFLRQRNQNVFV